MVVAPFPLARLRVEDVGVQLPRHLAWRVRRELRCSERAEQGRAVHRVLIIEEEVLVAACGQQAPGRALCRRLEHRRREARAQCELREQVANRL
eukprot:7289278-Prymnesium_polylepis.1